ncbi:hypothetical protein N8T08_002228 [Aspergillus melleus]|uniref:Uncharacterized protein n=1 Tax=Aspergillus melleus TaxID=138277 RepID=A0ACC3B915_9EURO|nr:hypothetical protein N8T08_002228 [Aspergillus melleus]
MPPSLRAYSPQPRLDGALGRVVWVPPDSLELETDLCQQRRKLPFCPLEPALHKHVEVHEIGHQIRAGGGGARKDHLSDQEARGKAHGPGQLAQDDTTPLVVVVVLGIA